MIGTLRRYLLVPGGLAGLTAPPLSDNCHWWNSLYLPSKPRAGDLPPCPSIWYQPLVGGTHRTESRLGLHLPEADSNPVQYAPRGLRATCMEETPLMGWRRYAATPHPVMDFVDYSDATSAAPASTSGVNILAPEG